MSAYTPQQFVEAWRGTTLGERQSYQLHFIDLCRMVGAAPPGPDGRDAGGHLFAFEYGVKKDSGGHGFADVFYENHFAIEYKAPGKYRDLTEAYQQLLQYREKLNNPPLLVVTDIESWEIHTNWPNSEKRVYRFQHEDIARRPSVLQHLRDLFEAPERLHPRRNTEQVTADAARVFQVIADNMRSWEAEPERIAHYLTKLVFCLFAEDVSLLPQGPKGETGIFSEIIERTRREPARFVHYTEQLFGAMADGGEVMFATIPWFNGSLFDDITVEPLSLEALTELERAARLNWESVEPAIFGTLFERSLDPAKRSQLGAHYTSREDILLIVEPVLMGPLRREWETIQAEARPIRQQYEAALAGSNRRQIAIYGGQLETLRERMLQRLREIRVLDPACGSGNFLYISLQLLMDMEKEVMFSDLFAGLQQPFPAVHPRQMYGIEINPIAHALASIVVWIGYIQWRKNNGYYQSFGEPILEALRDNIVCRDAILEFPSLRSGEGPGVGNKLAQTRTSPEIWAKIRPLAREMRQEPTPAEDALWQRLRGKQVHGQRFRRQHPIDHFIVDFFCAGARLVVEVDGPIHEQQQEQDALRQAFIESLGLRVLRFSNDALLADMDTVLAQIEAAVLSPPPGPLPDAQGEAVREPAWPEVDVIVGNPPFLGGKKMLGELDKEYVSALRQLYKGRVTPFSDFVTYWFERARTEIERGRAKRAGLLATNSIGMGVNLHVLKKIKETGDIFMAWDDREWVLDGAAVRVAMIGFDDGTEISRRLNDVPVQAINADLTAGVNLTVAKKLKENENIGFIGVQKSGPFDIDTSTADKMLRQENKSGVRNSDVIHLLLNGSELVRRPQGRYIIDFGVDTPMEAAAQYEAPFAYIQQHVIPKRTAKHFDNYPFWLLWNTRPAMREAMKSLGRYIATPTVAKHRLFAWLDRTIVPDKQLVAITRDDDYFFGVLHSRLHETWSLRMGTWLGKGNDPRYTPTTTFETFPFPWLPGQEDTASPQHAAISAAAKQLHEERAAWLNPPGMKEAALKKRTLTNLYNALNVWRGVEAMRTEADAADFAPRLDDLHRALDRAVCAAYGWDDLAEMLYTPAGQEEILRRLLALNLARANAR